MVLPYLHVPECICFVYNKFLSMLMTIYIYGEKNYTDPTGHVIVLAAICWR